MFAALPHDASSIGYMDLGAVAKFTVDSALKEMEKKKDTDTEDSDGQELAEWTENWDWKLFSKFFGPLMFASVKTEDGYFGTYRMIHPE